MLERNHVALKEWAVVVEALARGRQMILLRKGGIEEEEGEFRVEHREFFFSPTYEHPHRRHVRPEFYAEFDRALAAQLSGGEVRIRVYALVAEMFPVETLDALMALSEFHIWTEEFLRMRLAYKPERPLLLLALRVYTVPGLLLPFRAEYRGCKSWVELDRELSTADATAVVDESEFERSLSRLRALTKPANSQVGTTQARSSGLE